MDAVRILLETRLQIITAIGGRNTKNNAITWSSTKSNPSDMMIAVDIKKYLHHWTSHFVYRLIPKTKCKLGFITHHRHKQG